MEHIFIQKPCSENWKTMLPTQQGAFCAQCAKEVTDFTRLTHNEVKWNLLQPRDGEQCGRFHAHQLKVLNTEIDAFTFRSTKSFQSALVFSMIVVFGLTLFSCSSEQQQREVEQVRAQAKNAMKELAQTSASQNEQMLAAANEEVVHPTAITLKSLRELELIEAVVVEDTHTLEEVVEVVHEYHVLGGVGYRDFITIEALPEMIANVELDANGVPFPTQFDALVYPNPTTGPTTFKLDVPTKQRFTIHVFNMNGQLIQTLTDQEIDRGTYRQEFDLSEQPTGMYLVTIFSPDFRKTVRVSKL